MEPLVKLVVDNLSGQGLPLLLVITALVWLQKSNSGLIEALNLEREERIATLEAMAKACEEDRRVLHEEMKSMWTSILEMEPTTRRGK